MKNIVSPARLLVLLALSFAVHGAILWAVNEKNSLDDGSGSATIQADFGAGSETTEVTTVDTPAAPTQAAVVAPAPVVEEKVAPAPTPAPVKAPAPKKVIATTLPKKDIATKTKTPLTEEKLPKTTVANSNAVETENLDPEIMVPVQESIDGVAAMSAEDEAKEETEAAAVTTKKEEPIKEAEETLDAMAAQTQEKEMAPVAAPVPTPTSQTATNMAPAKVAAVAAIAGPAAAVAAPNTATSATPTGGNGTGKVRSYQSLRQAAGNQPPQYPTQARRLGQQGDVDLKYFVTDSGKVQDVVIEKSSGSTLLDSEAVRAISAYKFFPGQSGWTTHPVKFSLKGPQEALPSRLRTSGSSLGN